MTVKQVVTQLTAGPQGSNQETCITHTQMTVKQVVTQLTAGPQGRNQETCITHTQMTVKQSKKADSLINKERRH
jgi:hypothetical protein